jgi:hypothetical protein
MYNPVEGSRRKDAQSDQTTGGHKRIGKGGTAVSGLPQSTPPSGATGQSNHCHVGNPNIHATHAGLQAGVNWVKRFNREGLAGLEDKPKAGRPPAHNEETNRMKDEHISTEHMFLAILSERDTPTAQLLQGAGINRDRVNASMQQLRGGRDR